MYGHVILLRSKCPKCKSMAIILDEKYQCCDTLIGEFDKEKTKRMIEGKNKRNNLSIGEKKEILELQNNECAYCNCDLENSWYIKKNMEQPRPIKIHFDHVIPWSYSRETTKYGMVATCNICNLLKSNKMFDDELELINFIRENRIKKGIEVM